jgi:hypothetical protein
MPKITVSACVAFLRSGIRLEAYFQVVGAGSLSMAYLKPNKANCYMINLIMFKINLMKL